jgi:hypothetical protein
MQVECVSGLGDNKHTCDNQRFQKGVSASLSLDTSPDKGVVLLADQALMEREFVVQYTGEVISSTEYTLRQQVLTCVTGFNYQKVVVSISMLPRP